MNMYEKIKVKIIIWIILFNSRVGEIVIWVEERDEINIF